MKSDIITSMARRCAENCPRIQGLLNESDFGVFFSSAVGDFKAKSVSLMIEEAKNCPGPRVEVIDVRKGIIHRKIVQEEVLVCGLDQAPIFATAKTPTQA